MKWVIRPDGAFGAVCTDGAGVIPCNMDADYENRSFVFDGEGFLFDGYSHWFPLEAGMLPQGEVFTLSLCLLPLAYSAHGDGLFSCCRDNLGMELRLMAGGKLLLTLGMGRECIEFPSIRAHLRTECRNVVTVVFRGDAGWCDLYVNGVLSNRRQFRRHTTLAWPEGTAYLGRRVNSTYIREKTSIGCFYGFLYWMDLLDGAMTDAQVRALHEAARAGAQDPRAVTLGAPRRSDYANDRHRPCYHLIPPGKWMNEPHGPLHYNGSYHIFYQANPHAPIWDHLSWGHLESADMVHWFDRPLALMPEDSPLCPDGCWSGSSVVGKDGIPRIYFTAGDDRRFPNQAVAMATPKDTALTGWEIHPRLIQEQDAGWLGEFRDPFVWLEGNTYFMLVGTGDAHNGGGNALLYSSPDGLSWENHGFVMDYDFDANPEVGHVWELPVLLPLRDEAERVACHILLLCACQIENDVVETYYFLGHWDAAARQFTPLHSRARLLDLGKGTFTGPSGFVTPDGRSVVFTIAQGKRSFEDECHAGWAHNGGLPVELSLRDGALAIQPIRELAALRRELLVDLSGTADPNPALARCCGDRMNLQFTATGSRAAVALCFGGQRLVVQYDRVRWRVTVTDGDGKEVGRYRGPVDDVTIGAEPIFFDCYLDHSMLEIYINRRKSVTLRNYPADGNRHFQVFGTGSVRLWKMEKAY